MVYYSKLKKQYYCMNAILIKLIFNAHFYNVQIFAISLYVGAY